MPGRALRRRDEHPRRYPRRRLGSGGAAAPERESLALLPSGPDAVRTLPVRGTRSVNAACADPVPKTPSLGRRSAPHGADFGFREPLPPHLARPGRRRVALGPCRFRPASDYDRSRDGDRSDPLYGCRVPVGIFGDRPSGFSNGGTASSSPGVVMIGLREEVGDAAVRGFDPARAAARHMSFGRRYGMPFGLVPKSRPAATGRGCRAVVAARLLDPGSDWRVLRAPDRVLHDAAAARRRRADP